MLSYFCTIVNKITFYYSNGELKACFNIKVNMFIQVHDSINFIESFLNNDHGFINNVHGLIINDHGSTIKRSWFHHNYSRFPTSSFRGS